MSDFYSQTGYPEIYDNEVHYLQNQLARRANFENSWIKNHISASMRPSKKKLSLFLDRILTYDFQNSPQNQKEESIKSKIPDHNSEVVRGLNTKGIPKNQSKEPEVERHMESDSRIIAVENLPDHSSDSIRALELTVPKESTSTLENKTVKNETEKKQTELQFGEYITETWEKYRKRYEHLGEKNPFASDPPSPEFLLSKTIFSGKRKQSASHEKENENRINYKHGDASLACEDNEKNIAPSQSDDENLKNNDVRKNGSEGILEENNAIDSIEPDLEPEAELLDYQSESATESDRSSTSNDSFSPIEEKTLLGKDIMENQVHDDKQSASVVEDEKIVPSNEYDEIKYYKPKRHSRKAIISSVRSLSSNKDNYSPERYVHSATDIRMNDFEFQQPENVTREYLKPKRQTQKQFINNSTLEPRRPLVNPYLVSPFGGPPMMPQPNSLYSFQPSALPYNFWIAKPPFNHFNMFPYGYPWQSLSFAPPYFHPLFQPGIAPNPCVGSPLVGHHMMSPTASTQDLLNTPLTELYAGPRYGSANVRLTPEIAYNETEDLKANYNQEKRASRPYQSQFQKYELNFSQPGHYAQHYQNVHQRNGVNRGPFQSYKYDQKWIPGNEINSVSSHHRGRDSTRMIDTTDVRHNQMHNSYNPRLDSFSLPSSEYRIPNPSPIATNQYWNRDHPNLGSNVHRFHTFPSPYTPHNQQRANDHNQQYVSFTNENEINKSRSNNEFPTRHVNEQPSVPQTSFHSWFSEQPQFGHGNFSPQTLRTEE